MPYKVDVDGVVCQISTDSLGIGWIFGGEKDWRMEREIAPSFSINCHQLHGLSLKLLPPPTVLQYRHQFAISLVSVISRIALILSIACCCCLCRGTGAVQNLQSARSSSFVSSNAEVADANPRPQFKPWTVGLHCLVTRHQHCSVAEPCATRSCVPPNSIAAAICLIYLTCR